MKHPLYGKRPTEIDTNKIHSLTSGDFVSYTNWLMQVRLNYLIAEGFVDVAFDTEGVPTYNCVQTDGTYRLLSETEMEESVLQILLQGIGRYI